MNKTNKITGRNNKFNLAIYIKLIYHSLKYALPWRSLPKIFNINMHYTTLYKFYNKLCKLNIFDIIYHRMILKYKKLKGLDKFENLFIDASMIKNIYGSEKIGSNHYDRNKSASKLNIIVDDIGAPLSYHVCEANIADVKLAETTITNLYNNNNKINIIADKGYVNDKLKNNLHANNINLIYPYKINQHKINTKNERKLLGKRYIVENTFSWIKQFKRLRLRYDQKYISFINFVSFGLTLVLYKKYIFLGG